MATQPAIINAIDFNYSAITSSGPNVTGTGTIQIRVPAPSTPAGLPILFNTSCPIAIGADSNYEVVTPTAVSYDQFGNINITADFTYAHGTGEPVSSSTYGLNEAAAYATSKGGGLVALTPQWFGAVGAATHADAIEVVTGSKSQSADVTILDYSGISGSVSYKNSTVGDDYTATANVLY